jgi:hypothetical protein
MIDSDTIMKALVAIAIEKALLGIGKPAYETVSHALYKKYRCYIPDCYEKPEYLREVLKDLFGESYKEIISTIEEQLEEFSYKKKIKTFLQVLL